MSGGDIAGLIAAGVFAILVALLALPIIRLTKVFDELIVTIRSLNQSTSPLINEVTKTVVTTNEQLEKVDGITSNVSDASANVSALSSLVTSTVGQPLIKVASFSYGVRQAFRGKKPGDDDRAAGTSPGGEQ
jgi:secreted protein